MAGSTNRQILETIAHEIDLGYLSARGFKRQGSIFRREMEPGFVHIVDLGLGQSWSQLSGHFTVDIGIFVREAFELFFDSNAPRRPTAAHCELRKRLGMLRSPARDQWWALTMPIHTVVAEIGAQLEQFALPFLEQLADRRAFIDSWRWKGRNALGLPPRGDLVAAAILYQLGDEDAANEVLNAALAESTGKRTETFVAQVAAKLRSAQ